jgi:hypothetical protein
MGTDTTAVFPHSGADAAKAQADRPSPLGYEAPGQPWQALVDLVGVERLCRRHPSRSAATSSEPGSRRAAQAANPRAQREYSRRMSSAGPARIFVVSPSLA